MTDDQSILQEIGLLLWSIFPEEASKIVFEGQLYPGQDQIGPSWYDADGKRLGPNDYGPLMEINDQMRSLARQLQMTPPFDAEPFTHMRYVLNTEGKMDVRFAYIPEWDAWPNLYMQGVSQVSEDDAKKRPRFYETWKECRARFEREPYPLPSIA
jgi:hypothetical protein